MIVERFVTVGSIRSRELSVAGDGPAIVLLHGFTDSADSFRPLLTELAARSRRAVAVDLPGGGFAGPLGRPAFAELDRFVADLVRGMDGDVVLVGNSLGGLIALRAAARGDLPIRAVAGLATAGVAYRPRIERIGERLARIEPALRVTDTVPLPRFVLQSLARSLYRRRLARGRGNEYLAHLYASHVRGVGDVARIRGDLLAFDAEGTVLPASTLRRIAVPVSLLWGDRDRLVDSQRATAQLEPLPRARSIVLADCGHCPQIEYPQIVAGLIAELADTVAT